MNTKITINTEYITLGGFLKFCGAVGTGGESKELILSGGVLVDGEQCTMRGKKLRPGNVVSFAGREEVYEVSGLEG